MILMTAPLVTFTHKKRCICERWKLIQSQTGMSLIHADEPLCGTIQTVGTIQSIPVLLFISVWLVATIIQRGKAYRTI